MIVFRKHSYTHFKLIFGYSFFLLILQILLILPILPILHCTKLDLGFEEDQENAVINLNYTQLYTIPASFLIAKVNEIRNERGLPPSINDLVNPNPGLNFSSSPVYDVTVYSLTYPVTYPEIGNQSSETYIQSALFLLPSVGSIDPQKLTTSGWATLKGRPYNNIGTGSEGFPLLYRTHGTIFHNKGVPTACNLLNFSNMCEAHVALFEAAQGFAVVMPDYLGFGVSANQRPIHPFIAPEYYQYEAETLLNFITKSGKFADTVGLKIKTRKSDGKQFLFLAGYSEGGFATLAIQKYLENSGNDYPYLVTASAPGAAPADLALTAQKVYGRDFYAIPSFFAYVYFAYKDIYNWNFDNTDFFRTGPNIDLPNVNYGDAGYGAIVSKIYDSREVSRRISDPNNWYKANLSNAKPGDLTPITQITKDEVSSLFVQVKNATINKAGFDSYNVWQSVSPDPNNSFIEIYNKLVKNSVHTGWTAKADTRIYHCALDAIIPGITLVNDGGYLMSAITKVLKSQYGIDVPVGYPIPGGSPLPDTKKVMYELGLSKILIIFKSAPELLKNNLKNIFGSTFPISNTTQAFSNLNPQSGPLKVLPITYKNLVNDPNGALLPLTIPYRKAGKVYKVIAKPIDFSFNVDLKHISESSVKVDYGDSTLDAGNINNVGHSSCNLIGSALPWFVTYLNR